MSNDREYGVKVNADFSDVTGESRAAAAEIDKMGQSTSRMASEASRLDQQQKNMAQSLNALGREAVSGNFSRMPGQFLNLARNSDLSAVSIARVAVPVAVLAAAGYTLAKAFAEGAQESREMNKALDVTNNYAGMTASTMHELARSVADSSTLTINASKQIVTQLVASGQVGMQSISAVAKLADDYANATGRDVKKIAPDLVKLFDDPAKGAAELNKQMHFLSAAEIEHIAHLQRIGELDAAQLELAQKLNEHLPKHKDNLGLLESAWNSVRKAASGAWDAMLDIGREQSLDKKLAEANAQLADLMSRRGVSPAKIAAATANRDDLQAQSDEEWARAAQKGRAGAANTTSQQAAALVNQVSDYQKIAELRDKIVLAGKADENTAQERQNKTRTIYELNKQIESIYRSIGAEARQLNEQQIAGAIKLFDIQNRGAVNDIEAQFKLGNITQQQRDQQALGRALAENEEKQMGNARLQAMTGLTALERERLVVEGQVLALQANELRNAAQRVDLLREAAYVAAQAATDAQAAQATTVAQLDALARLDAQIQSMRDHNAEIGKTKEQIDRLRGAELGRAISEKEHDRNSMLNEGIGADSPEVQRLDAQIAKLKEIQGLYESGATAEAAAAANRKMQQDFKRTANMIERGLTDSLMRGFESGKGFGENFRDVLINMFKTTILRPIIQAQVQPVANAITGALGSSGFGGIFGAIGNLLGLGGGSVNVGVEHDGGIAGLEAAAMRNVPVGMFAGAKRYHQSGIIGHDEVPIIAKRGEGVFTESQMKALAPAGRGGDVYHIDARHADPAGFDKLIRLIEQLHGQIKPMALDAVAEENARG